MERQSVESTWFNASKAAYFNLVGTKFEGEFKQLGSQVTLAGQFLSRFLTRLQPVGLTGPSLTGRIAAMSPNSRGSRCARRTPP